MASIDINNNNNICQINCSGEWTINHVATVVPQLKSALSTIGQVTDVTLDISAVDVFDSAGAILLLKYSNKFTSRGYQVTITGASDEQQRMLAMYRQQLNTPTEEDLKKPASITDKLEHIGKKAVDYVLDSAHFFSFLGETFSALIYYIVHPSSIRFRAIIRNIEDAGVRALPIVALTSFLIGVVIAYQSAVQLEKFGASIFIVDMIGISVTRELSPLITAIVVAGRSGSSYTAQLGVMKITEEIDAMKTMGFDPYRFLVLPRMIALMIAMPLMIFFADLVGIFGGMFISNIQLNMSYSEFASRLQSVLETKHVWVGIVKGPFFAGLIAAVGCYRGFQVSYNTESIGRYTTISVVNAIFLVIACDAAFSVVLTELGI
jgi:phospholipid/cholesterol/gamma-HCH transport system permease protein